MTNESIEELAKAEVERRMKQSKSDKARNAARGAPPATPAEGKPKKTRRKKSKAPAMPAGDGDKGGKGGGRGRGKGKKGDGKGKGKGKGQGKKDQRSASTGGDRAKKDLDPNRESLKTFNAIREMKAKKGESQANVCLWFLANNKCHLGDKCSYSHAKVELTGDQKKALELELPLMRYARRKRSQSAAPRSASPGTQKDAKDKKDIPCRLGKNCNVFKSGGNCPFKHT